MSWRLEETWYYSNPSGKPSAKIGMNNNNNNDHTDKWYMHNPTSVLENAIQKLLRDFDIKTDHLILARRSDLIKINKKKRTCKIVDFAVPADHRVQLKESEKKNKYLDFARQLNELWNMNETFIPILISVFGTVTRRLEDLEISGRLKTI